MEKNEMLHRYQLHRILALLINGHYKEDIMIYYFLINYIKFTKF